MQNVSPHIAHSCVSGLKWSHIILFSLRAYSKISLVVALAILAYQEVVERHVIQETACRVDWQIDLMRYLSTSKRLLRCERDNSANDRDKPCRMLRRCNHAYILFSYARCLERSTRLMQ